MAKTKRKTKTGGEATESTAPVPQWDQESNGRRPVRIAVGELEAMRADVLSWAADHRVTREFKIELAARFNRLAAENGVEPIDAQEVLTIVDRVERDQKIAQGVAFRKQARIRRRRGRQP